MAWQRGKDTEIYISTENPTRGLSQSGEDMAVGVWGATSLISDFVVPPLKTDSVWTGAETDATGSFPARAYAFDSIIGLDPDPDAEREDIDLMGRNTQDSINLRQSLEITLSKKVSGPEWGILFKQADAGLSGAGATTVLNPADDETEPESGYRVFIKLADGSWITGRNCTLKSYKLETPPVKTATEVLTFHSNIWNFGTQSYITPTTATEL